MADLLRQAPIGTFVRVLTGNRVLAYPEQKPNYSHPPRKIEVEVDDTRARASNSSSNTLVEPVPEGDRSKEVKTEGAKDETDPERGDKLKRRTTIVHDHTYVHWREEDGADPDQPINWSNKKKLYVTFVFGLYTTVVYIASAIVTNTAGLQLQAAEFPQAKQSEITLGLTLFVFGYSIAPLVLTPVTALPQYGRQWIYVGSFFLYICFLVGSAAVRNLPGYLVMRLLCGIAGSPAISTVGVSLSDTWGPMRAPRAIGIWGSFATLGPVMGPLIGAAAVVRYNSWRAPLYVLACVAAFTFVLIFFTMPETSPDAILHRRMLRLRRASGRNHFETEWLKEGKDISIPGTIKTACACITDPSILYVTAQVALVYMILYDWFESFPIVFGPTGYGFTPVQEGLVYFAIGVGVGISVVGYLIWLIKVFEPAAERGEMRPELFIQPNFVSVFALPVCLFFFGWTANRTPWYVPMIASIFFGPGAFLTFMSGLNYLTLAFPSIVMPIFAINAVARGVIAAFGPLYAQPAEAALGVAKWSSLLGAVSLIMIPLPFILLRYGKALRKRSRYAPDEQ